MKYDAGRRIGKKKRNGISIVVPRGGELRISLADGTRVWLNSSLA